jgi:hypothetical protein
MTEPSFRRCSQCGSPAVFGYRNPNGPELMALCLEHSDQYELMLQRRTASLQDYMDRLDDQINDTVGLPRQPRPPRTSIGKVLMHQVHIHGNNNGVVNTGTIGRLEQSISIINASDPGLAEKLKALTDAVVSSDQLADADKQSAADLLATLSVEAAKPKASRSPTAVLKAIFNGLDVVLQRAPQLLELWRALSPILERASS